MPPERVVFSGGGGVLQWHDLSLSCTFWMLSNLWAPAEAASRWHPQMASIQKTTTSLFIQSRQRIMKGGLPRCVIFPAHSSCARLQGTGLPAALCWAGPGPLCPLPLDACRRGRGIFLAAQDCLGCTSQPVVLQAADRLSHVLLCHDPICPSGFILESRSKVSGKAAANVR